MWTVDDEERTKSQKQARSGKKISSRVWPRRLTTKIEEEDHRPHHHLLLRLLRSIFPIHHFIMAMADEASLLL
jgi:hypothetical protein